MRLTLAARSSTWRPAASKSSSCSCARWTWPRRREDDADHATAVAELERDLLVERTQAGLAKTKQQGKVLGRPATTTAEQRADILPRHKAGASISDRSCLHGVSRAMIMRIARPEKALAQIKSPCYVDLPAERILKTVA